MEPLTIIGYFLLIDVIASLITFSILYYFRKDMLIRLRSRLQSFLGITVLVGKVEGLEEEVYDELKPAMRKAMDDVFELGDNDEHSS